MLDDARDRAAKILGAKPSEIVFTSGGTESNNLAIFGTARFLKPKGRHLITSTIEHHAVLNCFDYLEKKEGFEVTRLPVDSEGLVSVDDLRRAIRPDTILVSIMAANNEIGTIQPVAELGAVCRERGVIFHTDAVQWFGKEPVENIGQFNADLVSVCAHKFHGPKGAGLLYIKSPLLPDPILFGGGHENERRAGTENLAGIVGLVEAMERFVKSPVFERAKLAHLVANLFGAIEKIDGAEFVGSRKIGWRTRFLLSFGVPTAPRCWPGWIWKESALLVVQLVLPVLWNPLTLFLLLACLHWPILSFAFLLAGGPPRKKLSLLCKALPEIVRRAQLVK